MIELDVRGLSCPEPVLNLKPLCERGEREIKVLCSCGASSDNIKRMTQHYGYKIKSEEKNNNDLIYHIIKGD
ncbi:MAG: sulfurtransferase TusA family protein [Helicobacteraceae bacterium]|nr:sulfurtransferase TusA family protein [Helicobacteraceae bacterium]